MATGEVVRCRIKGKFKLRNLKLTNPVAVGDEVEWEMERDEQNGTIHTILPRRNYVARQSPRQKHFLHLLAANVDKAVVVTTVREPNVKIGFIDRFLLMTEPEDIPAVIVFNKLDIYDDDDLALLAHHEAIYKAIGYEVLRVSAETGEGLAAFRDVLCDSITFITGHSGVGKSSIVNALAPNLDLRTNDISDYSGKGQHTTTFAEMHPLPFGTQSYIIDTPGIKELAFISMEAENIKDCFREMLAHAPACRFNNCMHADEPDCAVKAAVRAGGISEARYFSYLNILAETQEQNVWDMHEGI